MSFGQDFLKGFFGSDYVKDFRHASKTFRSAGYDLAPRQKFLYHVYFNLNTNQIPVLNQAFPKGDKTNLGLLVKEVQLPQYEIDTDTLNQYNRKRIIQKKINYKPIRLTMHDDSADLARKLWYNYYSYYYKDPSQSYNGVPNRNGNLGTSSTPTGMNYNDRDIYNLARSGAVNDWGFIGESYADGTASPNGKPPFFLDIVIYGFSQKKAASYTLINPVIVGYEHDDYNYSDGGGILENTMTIAYETVKYGSDVVSQDSIPGFGDPSNYDTSPSTISRPGSTGSITGPGGILSTIGGLGKDLEAAGKGDLLGILGAVQKAGALKDQGRNIGSIIKGEARGKVSEILRDEALTRTIRSGISTPTPPGNNNTTVVGNTKTYR